MAKFEPKEGEEKELLRIILRGEGQTIVGVIHENYHRYLSEVIQGALQDSQSLPFTTKHGKIIIGSDLCRKASILIQKCTSYNEKLPWEK